MTEREILKWIDVNLGPEIDKALTVAREKNPALSIQKIGCPE
jgi:hypothetical protein